MPQSSLTSTAARLAVWLGIAATAVILQQTPAQAQEREALLMPGKQSLQQRVLTGSSFGAGHQRTDVPMLIDLYMSGRYKLDEMITRRVGLSELNNAFDLMLRGEVKRSVVVY